MRGSRSLTMLFGMPCGPMMVRSVVLASCTEPSDVRAAAKRFSFVSRSTYTWMASKPRFDLRQAGHRVRRPVQARLLRQRQRHQQARRQLLAVLVALARVARQHVLLDVAWPCRATRSALCASASMRSRPQCAPVGAVVQLGQDARPQRRVRRHAQLRPCSANSSPRLACVSGGGDCSQRWYSSSAAAARRTALISALGARSAAASARSLVLVAAVGWPRRCCCGRCRRASPLLQPRCSRCGRARAAAARLPPTAAQRASDCPAGCAATAAASSPPRR